MTIQRCLSLFVALCVACFVVFSNGATASASENVGGWIELLETATVDDSGSNLVVTSTTSHFFRIKTPDHMWCTKVDMIVSHDVGRAPKHIKVMYNGGYYTLTKVSIDSRTSRFFGDNIPDALYADLVFEIVKNDTYKEYFQILSCRVTPLMKQDYPAEAFLYRSVTDASPLQCPANYTVDGNGADYMHTMGHLVKVHVTDWRKYDSITIYGSFSQVGLNSIRPSIGNKGLSYDINYTVSNPTYSETKGFVDTEYYLWSDQKHYEYDDSYQGSVEGSTVGEVVVGTDIGYGGNILYTMTIDLCGVDRSITNDLVVYFTLVYDSQIGYAANVQNVTGSINTADTSSVSWWNRFTVFMEGLFAADSSQTNDMMESVTDQSKDLAEDRLGAVAQAGAVIDDLTGVFQYQGVMDTIAFPALTINFGGVPWTFGGWDVSVIPPGFEPLVESLKLLIDIVATLAFIQAMRHRLEKLLVGGNA